MSTLEIKTDNALSLKCCVEELQELVQRNLLKNNKVPKVSGWQKIHHLFSNNLEIKPEDSSPRNKTPRNLDKIALEESKLSYLKAIKRILPVLLSPPFFLDISTGRSSFGTSSRSSKIEEPKKLVMSIIQTVTLLTQNKFFIIKHDGYKYSVSEFMAMVATQPWCIKCLKKDKIKKLWEDTKQSSKDDQSLLILTQTFKVVKIRPDCPIICLLEKVCKQGSDSDNKNNAIITPQALLATYLLFFSTDELFTSIHECLKYRPGSQVLKQTLYSVCKRWLKTPFFCMYFQTPKTLELLTQIANFEQNTPLTTTPSVSNLSRSPAEPLCALHSSQLTLEYAFELKKMLSTFQPATSTTPKDKAPLLSLKVPELKDLSDKQKIENIANELHEYVHHISGNLFTGTHPQEYFIKYVPVQNLPLQADATPQNADRETLVKWCSNALDKAILGFNKISAFTADNILTNEIALNGLKTEFCQRHALFSAAAKICWEKRDFFSAMALYSGLSHGAIIQSFEGLKGESHSSEYEFLMRKCSFDANSKELRREMKQVLSFQQPNIPHIAILQSDIEALSGNPKRLENNQINTALILSLFQTFECIHSAQRLLQEEGKDYANYDIETFLKDTPTLLECDKTLYERKKEFLANTPKQASTGVFKSISNGAINAIRRRVGTSNFEGPSFL